MPTYVYECSSCSSTFEVDQRITESPLDSCACGSTGTVKRLIQPIAVMFKGSGFHINDYSAASAPKAEAKTEAKAESKPEAPAACTSDPSSCACATSAD
jgi:putative FmdB family regulatory protein